MTKKPSTQTIINAFNNPVTWIIAAILLIVLLAIAAVCIKSFSNELFFDGNKHMGEYLTKVLLPIAAAIVAVFTVTLSIQKTNAQTKQTETMKDQLLETRFKNAIEHLGHTNTNTVLSGIYELHTIAKESKKYTQMVFDILCSYVRQTTGRKSLARINKNWEQQDLEKKLAKRPPLITIQTIFDLLYNKAGEDPVYRDEKGNYLKGNFTYSNLQHISLLGLHVQNADFSHSVMHAAQMYSVSEPEHPFYDITTTFTHCKFNKTWLQAANMSKATYTNCEFFGTKMVWVNLYESKIINCKFYKTDLTVAVLSKAEIQKTAFECCLFDGLELHEPNFVLSFENAKNYIKNSSFDFAFLFDPHQWLNNSQRVELQENTAISIQTDTAYYNADYITSRIIRLVKHISYKENTYMKNIKPAAPSEKGLSPEEKYLKVLKKIRQNCYPNNTPEDKHLSGDLEILKTTCENLTTPPVSKTPKQEEPSTE